MPSQGTGCPAPVRERAVGGAESCPPAVDVAVGMALPRQRHEARTGHGLHERAPLGRGALAVIQAVQADPGCGQRPAGHEANAVGTRHRAQRGGRTQGLCEVQVRAEGERHGAAEVLQTPLGERDVGQRSPAECPTSTGRSRSRYRAAVSARAVPEKPPGRRSWRPRARARRATCARRCRRRRSPRGEPLRDGVDARAPAAIPGQQQHQVARGPWRLKQPQRAELTVLNHFLVHAARRRTALAQERGAGSEQQGPSRTATGQAAQLLRKADTDAGELNGHATLFHCGCLSAITARARLQSERSW